MRLLDFPGLRQWKELLGLGGGCALGFRLEKTPLESLDMESDWEVPSRAKGLSPVLRLQSI